MTTPTKPTLATLTARRSKLTKHLGIAGVMARAFIHSPLSPLFLVACLSLGIMGLFFTPRQEDPQISVPMVDVFVQYSGASSEQVAVLVADPLERILSEISGVKHVYSASMRGQAMVTVEYDVGENLEVSVVKLRDKILSNMDKIPPGVQPPLIKPKAVDDVPVVALTLWSPDVNDSALRILALDVLQRLKEVPNSSEGWVIGGRSEQIRVEVFPERLAGYGISLDQIAQTVRTANSEQGIGSVETGDVGYRVYTGSFLKNADEISRLVVGVHNNSPVYVGDVARVFAGPEETARMIAYHTGQSYKENTPKASGLPAVTIAMAKKIGSNGVSVSSAVLRRVDELKGQMIPKNVFVSVTRNYGETANEKVNELLFKLSIATVAVTVLVWLSLGFRPALVTLIVIPVVILMTVFAAWLMGYTIDRVSLFALIFSIGILVDDAIVVVENIYRRWLLEDSCCTEISVDAVREVGNPTILATLTVIAALLPMGFVSGMMGPYMRPIPALGSVAMIFSLFAAFIFTPWLAQLIKPTMKSLHSSSQREHQQAESLERFYRRIIPPLVEDPRKGWAFLVSLLAIFFLSMVFFYTTAVTVKILPLDNKPEFNVVVNLPEGTALPKTANLVNQMVEVMRTQVPEITAMQTYVGTASPFNFNGMVRHYYLRDNPWEADIQVQLVHKRDRKRTSHDIAVATRELLTPLAKRIGARIQVVEMPPGPPVLQSVVAEVTGPSAEVRRQLARDLMGMFERAPSIVDVDSYMQDTYEVWRFEVNTEKAVRRGVSVDTINRNLSMAMGGARLGDVKRGVVQEPTYIVIQVPLEIRAKITNLSDLPIPTPTGGAIPVGELGRFVKGQQDSVLYHKDLRPVEFVTGEVVGRLDAPIYAMSEVEEMLATYKAPDGVVITGELTGPPKVYSQSGFEWTGEWTVTYETFRDMGIAFAAALILIYMLVVWEFGNFILPLIIMAPIPLTLIGIVPGHWIFNAKFTATSMIGFIALAGIIVRNSILLVDFTQAEILKGTEVLDAVVLSCKARTRPILITALALVIGSSVILTDFIFQGMAISLLFGALVSTLLTLVVIPLGCYSAREYFNYPESLPRRMLVRKEQRCEVATDPVAAPPQPSPVEVAPPPSVPAVPADDKLKRIQAARAFLNKYNQPGTTKAPVSSSPPSAGPVVSREAAAATQELTVHQDHASAPPAATQELTIHQDHASAPPALPSESVNQSQTEREIVDAVMASEPVLPPPTEGGQGIVSDHSVGEDTEALVLTHGEGKRPPMREIPVGRLEFFPDTDSATTSDPAPEPSEPVLVAAEEPTKAMPPVVEAPGSQVAAAARPTRRVAGEPHRDPVSDPGAGEPTPLRVRNSLREGTSVPRRRGIRLKNETPDDTA